MAAHQKLTEVDLETAEAFFRAGGTIHLVRANYSMDAGWTAHRGAFDSLEHARRTFRRQFQASPVICIDTASAQKIHPVTIDPIHPVTIGPVTSGPIAPKRATPTTRERFGLILETRYEVGNAARGNRGRYSGRKIHHLVTEYAVGLVPGTEHKPGTVGARFRESGTPVLYSAYPRCGTTQGQIAGHPQDELTIADVTCEKCLARFGDPRKFAT
jgi:hypothetical protein